MAVSRRSTPLDHVLSANIDMPVRRIATWLALAASFALASVLLAPVLVGGPLLGNDFPNSLAFASWIARAFPLMPFWFPYEGAGVSASAGYAVGPLWLVAGLLRGGVDDATALRALLLAAFVSAALGVTAMARAFRVPSWAAALAGLLFLLPPATWNLVFRVGLLQHITVPALAPWAIAATVGYLGASSWLGRGDAIKFAASAALCAATFVIHPAFAPITLALGMPTALGVRFSLERFLTVAIAAVVLASGALVAFASYNATAGVAAQYTDPVRVAQDAIPAEVLIGLTPVATNTDLYYGASLTLPLLVLGVIGAVVALRGGSLRLLAVAHLAALTYVFTQPLQQVAVAHLPSIAPLFVVRPWLTFALIAQPVLAANAVLWSTRLAKPRVLRVAAVAVSIALLVALERPGYGYIADGAPLPLRSRLASWNEQVVAHGSIAYDTDTARAIGAHLLAAGPRGDVSVELGGVYRGLPLVSPSRVLVAYTYTLPLAYESISNAQDAFYLPNGFGVAGGDVSEVAAWFGISAVALAPGEDRARYVRDGWTVRDAGAVVYADAPVRRSLAAFRERGLVLHVGLRAAQTYRAAFRFAWAGALPFDRGWLAEGPECVDDLSASDLALVDVLVLDGACVHDRARADELVQRYVESGGRLFVETGWESSPYATTDHAPAYLPADGFAFRGVGLVPSVSFDGAGVGGAKVDASAFGDFRYEDGTWNVSVPAAALREWARPVVSAGQIPVVVSGQLGRGRVVWSGMNLIAHAVAKGSEAERALYGAAMSWLLDGASAAPRELEASALAEDGGTVRAPADGWILWREPPAFASIEPRAAAIRSVGPGLLLARVGAGTYRIEQHPSAAMRASAIAGGVGLTLLAAWLGLAIAAGGAADPAGFVGWLLRRKRSDAQ